MNKIKMIVSLLVIFSAASAFASGEKEDNTKSVIVVKQYTDEEKSVLWSAAGAALKSLSENQPEILTMECDLTNAQYQTLLSQEAEVKQLLVDGKMQRTISPVETKDDAAPPGGAPENDREGRGGQGGGQGGRNGGPGRGGNDSGQGEVNNGEKSNFEFNAELAEETVELWDKALIVMTGLASSNYNGKFNGKTSTIFDFRCIVYEFIDESSGITGSLFIDAEEGVPVKTVIQNDRDSRLKIEIFVLPRNIGVLEISRVFFTTDVVSEDGKVLQLTGSFTPDYKPVTDAPANSTG